MAVTFYEGKMTPTDRWPEAVKSLRGKIGNDLTAFDVLCAILEDDDLKVSRHEDQIFVHGGDCWLRIHKDGVFEIGEPAA